MCIDATIRAVKYWLKLCKMSSDRLPKQAYGMLMNSKLKGAVNWAESVKSAYTSWDSDMCGMTVGQETKKVY